MRRFCAIAKMSGTLTAVAAFLVASPANASQPTVLIASAPLVSPDAAMTYYNSAGTTSQAPPSTRDPIVQEASRALRYNIDLIFEYARDNVEFLPMYGLGKGSRGVVLDGYGTAFDQAQFMVDALREADAAASTGYNPQYVLGRISVSGSDFSAWTGANTAELASKLLANGGIPAVVTGSGASFSVNMSHIWVQATVAGTNYLFDPSFKPHTVRAPMPWPASSSYSSSALMNGIAGNASSVSGFQTDTFRQRLASYRGEVEAYILANANGARADAVVGVSQIVQHPSTDQRRVSLPYVTTTDANWSGQIPNSFRTSFTVSLNNTAYGTYYADEVGGQTYAFSYGASGATFSPGSRSGPVVSGSFLGDCEQYIGSRTTGGTATAGILVNHPYAANSGGYADRTISRQIALKSCASGVFYVSTDWGYVGSGTSQRMAPFVSQARYDPNNSINVIIAPTIGKVASQYSAILDLAARQQQNFYLMHDLVGIHTLDNANLKISRGQNYFDRHTVIGLDFEAAVSAFSKSLVSQDDVAAAFTAGLGLSIAEGAVPRQEADAVYDMAAINLLTQQDSRAGATGTYSTYLSTPAQWSTTRGSLTNYPNDANGTSIVNSVMQNYVNEGYNMLVAQRGDLRQPPITVVGSTTSTSRLWEGYSLVAGNTYDGGEMIRSPFLAFRPSNGAGSAPDRVALVMYDPRRGGILKAGVGIAIDASSSLLRRPDAPKSESKDIVRAALNVDGRTGALSYRPAPDFVDGAGDFPQTLSLRRVYDQTDFANYGLGQGWKHNWNQTATLSNDGSAALGRGPAIATASALVAIRAMTDLFKPQDAQNLYAALQVASWMTDQSINNSVMITKGLDGEQGFYSLANGTYVSGKGDGETVTVNAPATAGIINRRLYLGAAMTYTDRDGSVRQYSTPNAPTPGYLDSPAIAGAYTKKIAQMDNWNFPNGIVVRTTHVSTIQAADVELLYQASNNLGRRILQTYYDFGSSTGDYYCNTDGGVVYHGNPRPAEVDYQTSTGVQVRYLMDAQTGQQLIGDPDSARCKTGTQTPPTSQIQQSSGLLSFVDPGSAPWSYAYTTALPGLFTNSSGYNGGGLGSITAPGDASATVQLTYGADNNVRSLTDRRGNVWSYYSSTWRSEVLSPLQSAANGSGAATYFDMYARPFRAIDPLQRVTTTIYDDRGNPIQVTQPEGNSVLTAYDARNNPVTVTSRAKPSSGLADIVKTTSYVEGATVRNCTNLVTCNRPQLVSDANGTFTKYTWDATSGEVTRVQQGLASDGVTCRLGSGNCPDANYGYASFTGIDGALNGTTNTASVVLPTSKIDTISTGVTTTTALTYNSSNKLLPQSMTVDSGGIAAKSCFTFDTAGNLLSATQPKGVCP